MMGLVSMAEKAGFYFPMAGRFEASTAGRGVVAMVEETLARWLGVPRVLGVSSGTLALYYALRAAGVGPGDEVIVPAFDWYAAAAAVLHCGAIPSFADVQPTTYTLDPRSARRRRSPRTRALIATHLFGNPCEMLPLRRWCDAHGIVLIEDASQALGAEYLGKRVGSWGDLACFSVTVGKPLTAGEGGLIACRDEHLYKRLLSLCAHPLRQEYAGVDVNPFALRAPLNPLGAALLMRQWETFPQRLQERQKAFRELNGVLEAERGLLLPVQVTPGATHAAYRFCPRVTPSCPPRVAARHLARHGIGAVEGSPAFLIPVALRRVLERGYFADHPDRDALIRASRTRCPTARNLSVGLITLDERVAGRAEDVERLRRALAAWTERGSGRAHLTRAPSPARLPRRYAGERSESDRRNREG
jgi:perosamine synthetase